MRHVNILKLGMNAWSRTSDLPCPRATPDNFLRNGSIIVSYSRSLSELECSMPFLLVRLFFFLSLSFCTRWAQLNCSSYSPEVNTTPTGGKACRQGCKASFSGVSGASYHGSCRVSCNFPVPREIGRLHSVIDPFQLEYVSSFSSTADGKLSD